MRKKQKRVEKVSTRRNYPTIRSGIKQPDLIPDNQNVPYYPYVRTSCGSWSKNENFRYVRVMKASGARNINWEMKVRNANVHPDLRRSLPIPHRASGHLVTRFKEQANTIRYEFAPQIDK